ncbi:FAD/NAD(P)-binding domain-containing protein [Suillus clintonianus]|uniref:FAD/NAD(P)-binding domain-containing protein n=1 Tax=Suillus clintonianus TaxID=1904413 RepID=UPI001B8611DD|nr:FAD/NAD(P)-binding domain-containing protein [Suillus clintonianus]KAG2129757.1 FAD/NAD(P)-binding domain-containing protein [Suillus clintonianus]
MHRLLIYSLLVGSSFAFQFPFNIPIFKSKDSALIEEAHASPRIAIIGAGAGGSSAAFWISKAKEKFGIDVEIDVYERSDYVGGRSTVVYPYNDTTLAPLELGASIFVDANKNLMRASKEFNLTLTTFEDDNSDTGIWDGQNFVLVIESGSYVKSWWATLKVLWRYGYTAPTRTKAIVQSMIDRFLGLYTPDSPRWDDISALSERLQSVSMTNQTASDFLEGNGVAPLFARELVEAATRVNYGQNVDKIHALGGAISMAASGASGVAAGNFLLFEKFLENSTAKVFLNTNVKEIRRKSGSSLWTVHTSAGSQTYKGVVLAAPFHQTDIILPSDLAELIPPQPYVPLHVTYLTTRSEHPRPEYFGLASDAQVPATILSTYEGARAGGVEPEFNSISYHGKVRKMEGAEGDAVTDPEWTVKIFSKERVSDEWLEKVFGNVGWVYRKLWQAYPVLLPTTEFPPVKLDQGFYYVNAFEPFISTMETETIASRNIVDLLLHEEFGTGICGSLLSETENATQIAAPADFVLGWDC